MRIKFPRTEKKEKTFFKANQQIKSEMVFLIDENGEGAGEMKASEALARAQEFGLDLVEVNPKANPPVVKIIDLGQMKYEHEKKLRKQKIMQKKIDIKNIRLSFRISDHDFSIRLNQAEKFLVKDNKVKVELNLKGREKQYPDRAKEIMEKFLKQLKEKEEPNKNLHIEVEQPLTRQGGRFTMIVINNKK
jgi:translation initiation factor IF-3